MTEDELRDHLGETVICTSRRCAGGTVLGGLRYTNLGASKTERGFVVEYPGRGARAPGGTWTLSRHRRSNRLLTAIAGTRSAESTAGQESADLSGLEGAIKWVTRMPITDKVVCPHCGVKKNLATLRITDLTRRASG